MNKTFPAGKKQLLLKAPSSASTQSQEEWSRVIRALNDAFRLSFTSTELFCSPGILKLDIEDQGAILQRVRDYRNFNEQNDPYMLHQRGEFSHEDHYVCWEIYCANLEGDDDSPNPANLDLTQRHMMIFIGDESWTRLPKCVH